MMMMMMMMNGPRVVSYFCSEIAEWARQASAKITLPPSVGYATHTWCERITRVFSREMNFLYSITCFVCSTIPDRNKGLSFDTLFSSFSLAEETT